MFTVSAILRECSWLFSAQGLHSTPALHTLLERRHHQARTDEDSYNAYYRPPLARELFANRPLFIEAIDRYPQCKTVVPRLRAPAVISGQRSIEAILQEIEEEATTYPPRTSGTGGDPVLPSTRHKRLPETAGKIQQEELQTTSPYSAKSS